MVTEIPWWEISLGISNLLLAGVVAWSSWYSSKKDRKVHIADKRMEWVREFRSNMAELMEAMRTMNIIINYDEKDTPFQKGDFEKETKRFYLIGERIGYLFPMDHKKGMELYEQIGKAYKLAEKVDFSEKKGGKALVKMEDKIYNLVDEIQNEQLERIRNLDTKSRLM